MIVVDTNIIAYLTLPSPYSPAAENLLLQDPDWIAPLLWRSELRNVLALAIRKSIVSFETAVAAQDEMEDLMRGREYEVSSLDVLSTVNQSNCSAYDCEFIALAQSCQCPLITMDRKLQQAFPEIANLLTAIV